MCRALAIWRKPIRGVIKRDKAKASLHKYIVYDFNTGKAPPSPQVRWAWQQNDGGGDAIKSD